MNAYRGVHPLDEITVKYIGSMGIPRYRNPDGTTGFIKGKHAESWRRYPKRLMDIDGRTYVEIPSGEWGITFHVRRPMKNPIARFFKYYAEGRASGYPFWPVFHFSVKFALKRKTR